MHSFHDLLRASVFFSGFLASLPNLIPKFGDLETLSSIEFHLCLIHLFNDALFQVGKATFVAVVIVHAFFGDDLLNNEQEVCIASVILIDDV